MSERFPPVAGDDQELKINLHDSTEKSEEIKAIVTGKNPKSRPRKEKLQRKSKAHDVEPRELYAQQRCPTSAVTRSLR